jgi:hypothetical protein
LCNACGYCKYAKFDFSLLAKPSSAVDPIDNDEDRKKVYYYYLRYLLAKNLCFVAAVSWLRNIELNCADAEYD